MANATFLRSVPALALGMVLGGLLVSMWNHPLHAQRDNPPDAATAQADLAR